MTSATNRDSGQRLRRLHQDTVAIPARSGRPRHHAIDALRGTAMFLVVTLHAALAYVCINIPELIWAVRESPSQVIFDPFCWWAMGVSLPLFFTIAGFFAADLFETRGPIGYLRNRAERILAPFLVGGIFILPACLYVWAYGWLESKRCTWREILRMKFHAKGLQPNLYGPAHLWFLEYVLFMLAAFFVYKMAVRALKSRGVSSDIPAEPKGKALIFSPFRPLLIAIPTTLIIWLSRDASGMDAVMNRHNSFIPDPIRLLHHSVFFMVGVWLQKHHTQLNRLVPYSMTYLALSVPVFVGRAILMREGWLGALDQEQTFACSMLGGLFGWLIVFGFLGVYHRYLNQPSARIRYLADSSYWIYLWHFPIVGLVQVDLYGAAIPTMLKFPIVLGTTFALGFSSYHVMVRYTLIGRWLHGPRKRPQATDTSSLYTPNFPGQTIGAASQNALPAN